MTTATVAKIGAQTKVKVGLQFGDLGYIAKPMTEERNMLINIGKNMHPKWKNEKRQQALQAELDKRGLTMADYERIQMRAARKFYTNTDADDGSGEIVIPRRHLMGMLVQTLKVAPKNAIPKVDQGLLHVGFHMVGEDYLRTGKTAKDAKKFSRFVKMEESNQRAWEEDHFIYDFTATGTLLLDDSCFRSEDVEKILEWGGKYVGLGSSRNQGYGRFIVAYWDVL